MNDQTVIAGSMWSQHARNIMPGFVRIIGRVIGEVKIHDINKRIVYNQVLDINTDEALKSDDLSNAVKNRWVEVIQGNEVFKKNTYTSARQQVVQPQQSQQQKQTNVENNNINLDDLKQLIVETTKETVKAVVDNMPSKQQSIDTNEIANAVANKITINNVQSETKKTEIDKTNNVFIDIDTKNELKTNIKDGELGTLTVQDATKAKNKIKKIKSLKINKLT